MSISLDQLTIKQAHQGLIDKQFSAEELSETYFQKIEQRDVQIHAFLSLQKKEALAQARLIDQQIKQRKEINLLAGIPLAIKDNILVKYTYTTAGSQILKDFVAPVDATVIRKLKEQGVILIGKTNMDEFAMGSSTENSAYGPTHNPHDLTRVPGGSSGGSAAAVAGRMCLGALGSDTGGSIRQPASFCGVVGIKPTYGRVSRYGLMAMASSLDQIGVLANNVDDAAIILSAIAGADKLDNTSQQPTFAINPKVKDITHQLTNLTIGLPKECFSDQLSKPIKQQINQVVEQLVKQGAKIKEVNLSSLEYALPCYYIIMPAEVSANLSRYDGIRYGNSIMKKAKNLSEVYFRTRGQYLGSEAKRRIMLGTYILSAGYYDEYYRQAQQVLQSIKQDFANIFKQVDYLITPTTPTTAFRLGDKIADPLAMYLSDLYTVSVNLTGLPAISLPIGNEGKLPIGLQIIGRHWEENQILQLGRVIEKLNND